MAYKPYVTIKAEIIRAVEEAMEIGRHIPASKGASLLNQNLGKIYNLAKHLPETKEGE